MIHVKTKSGFEIELDEKVMDDAELLDDFIALDEGKAQVLPRVIRKILGEDGKKRLYDHLRTPDGRVPYAEVSDTFLEIFSSFQGGKNSSASPN